VNEGGVIQVGMRSTQRRSIEDYHGSLGAISEGGKGEIERTGGVCGPPVGVGPTLGCRGVTAIERRTFGARGLHRGASGKWVDGGESGSEEPLSADD